MCSLEDGFVRGAQFSKWRQILNVKNNLMLKTDIMLDYW